VAFSKDLARCKVLCPTRNRNVEDLYQCSLTKTIVIDIVLEPNTTAPALAHSAFDLETDMMKPPTILTRRSVFRAGTGLAIAAMGTPLLTPASAQAEGVKPAQSL
jgi:hypothetical protein